MEGPLCHPGTKALIEQLQVVRGFNVGFRANRQPAVLALTIQGLCEASKPHGGEAYRSGLSGCATAIRLGIARHAAALPRPHSGIHPHADQHPHRPISPHPDSPHSLTQPSTPASKLDQGGNQRSHPVAHCGRYSAVPSGKERPTSPIGRQDTEAMWKTTAPPPRAR